MILKFIALTGIITASGLIGITKTKVLKERVAILEDYMQMIIELKGKINYFKEPLPVIFEKLREDSNSKAHMFLKSLSLELVKTDTQITSAWYDKLYEIYNNCPLTEEDIETIKYPGEFIGQTDFENHLYHFAYLEEKLKNQITEAKESLRRKGPMYNRIGFFLGSIGAIILF